MVYLQILPPLGLNIHNARCSESTENVAPMHVDLLDKLLLSQVTLGEQPDDRRAPEKLGNLANCSITSDVVQSGYQVRN